LLHRDVAELTPLDASRDAGQPPSPVRWALDGEVGFAVAVVVARYWDIAGLAELPVACPA